VLRLDLLRWWFILRWLNNYKSAVNLIKCQKVDDNDMGINEGGMVNGAMSRKVEITLNSAVSLVQTLQPLLFIPCYKSGGGWSGKCSETGEVTITLCGMKNSNHRHLLITTA
jgi:hypothetical protein